jgi:hypothetical protein
MDLKPPHLVIALKSANNVSLGEKERPREGEVLSGEERLAAEI